MHDFTRRLLTEWRKLSLPFADETFVVAVSGGADSLALALALDDLRKRKKLNLRFVVAHFNHNLRGAESEADEEFVKHLAAKYDFELALGRGHSGGGETARSAKGNLEQSARLARYEFLRGAAENLRARGVLTAHTMNDQAETFLINLIRGSGVAGLSGMKPVRIFNAEPQKREGAEKESDVRQSGENRDLFSKSAMPDGRSAIILARPLLNWAKREDTESFCQANSIEFRYDSMNEDLAFRRVRVRRVLLPLLRDFNPKIVERLANTAGLLRAEFEELDRIAPGFRRDDNNAGPLEIKDLVNLSPAARRRVLRAWLENERGDLRRLGAKHIEAIERLIASEKSGKTVELPNQEIVIKGGGRLELKKL